MRSLFYSIVLLTSFVQSAFCATPSPPKRDSIDVLFRRAPMASSSRSIAIPLATNLNLAFDAQLLRVHTAWNGPSLDLLGPPYSGKKLPFICTIEGKTLWTTPPFYPWSAGEAPAKSDLTNCPAAAHFRGLSTQTGNTTLIYDIAADGKPVRVHETAIRHKTDENFSVVREFQIAPCNETLWLLVHAEMGKFLPPLNATTVYVQRENDVLSVRATGLDGLAWKAVERDVNYDVERITDEGTVKGNPQDKVQGHQSRAYLKIPPHKNEIHLEIVSAIGGNASTPLFGQIQKEPILRSAPKIFRADSAARRSAGGDSFFRIEHFPLPKEIDLLVTGMDWLPDGTLAVCTWPGEIYIVEKAQGAPEAATYRRFARGLNEPMGLKVVDGKIYVAQKAELTRVLDTDKNGEADLYETVNADWDYSGSYDSFAFGPALDKQGNFYIAFAGNRGRYDVSYMGWAVQISPDGKKLEGWCDGLRAPNGIAAFGPNRDIFVSDNQGEWIGACKLNHLQRGKFYGFPSSFPSPKVSPKTFAPPAIWFPRKLSPSTTDMAEIHDARFGPFNGQMIVGDFQNAVLLRVMLEEVNGEWQGAVWPFAKNFLSGVNRLSFGPDGKLYVGGCQRAWASASPQSYSLERVSFTGKVPFEVEKVHALPDGFDLTFTEPVDVASANKPDSYDVSQFTYEYHKRYGSEEMDHDGKKNSSTAIAIKQVVVSPDKTKVRLVLAGLRPGYVTTIRCLDAQNSGGELLRNDTFYYTLNQIPK
jgi:hypothetical protein